jgi:hypothetical protein
MLRMIIRRTLAAGLALCSSLAFMPLGCAGSQEVAVAPSPGGGGSYIPSSIYAEIKACAGQGRARLLAETSNDLDFDVEVTEGGQVSRVRRRGLSPGDGGMESCIAHALEGMEVPPSTVQALVLQAEAGAGSPQARGLIGSPALLGVPLGAIMVFMIGATIVVTVTAYLAKEEKIEAARRRKKEQVCWELYRECLKDDRQPGWNIPTFGPKKPYLDCLGACQKPRGQWEDAKCPRTN